jgi:hypothetical protein
MRCAKAGGTSSRQTADLMTVEAYEALHRRDYLRVHAAAGLALEQQPKKVEATLARPRR